MLVLTAMPAHGRLTRAALAAGKHVLVEKPVATTLAEAREVLADAERSPGLLLCAPHILLSPTYRAMHARVQAGEIGALLTARARYGWAGPDWARWFYEPGGGALFDLGVYNVTSLCGFFGPARRVTAMTGVAIGERVVEGERMTVEAEDNAHVLIDFGAGRFAVVTTGFTMQKIPLARASSCTAATGVLQMLGDDWAPEGYELWRNAEGAWRIVRRERPELALDGRPAPPRRLHRDAAASPSRAPSTRCTRSRSCSRRRRPAPTAARGRSRRRSRRPTWPRCRRPAAAASTTRATCDDLPPVAPPDLRRADARSRTRPCTRHVWGDDEAGQVADWIYASTERIHALVFGLPAGGAFRHSPEFRTVFGADEVLHVLEGEMVLANPETGEVVRVPRGGFVFFRRDTWHHAFAHGAGAAAGDRAVRAAAGDRHVGRLRPHAALPRARGRRATPTTRCSATCCRATGPAAARCT